MTVLSGRERVEEDSRKVTRGDSHVAVENSCNQASELVAYQCFNYLERIALI